jgi:hypothetical protein
MTKSEIHQLLSEMMDINKLKPFNVSSFKNLIYQCNLNMFSKNGNNPLLFLLSFNKTKHLLFEHQEIYQLIHQSFQLSPIIQDTNGFTPLMLLLANNQSENLDLSQDEIYSLLDQATQNNQHLLKNSDGNTFYYFLIKNNKTQNLKLKPEQIFSLLKHMELNEKNHTGFKILSYRVFGFDC